MRKILRVTQYPPPPQPYGYGYDPYAPQQTDVLAPAKRASLMMFLLSGIMLLCGVCVGTFAFTVPIEKFISESGMTFPPPPAGMSTEEMIRIQAAMLGIGSLVVGVTLILLGVFVRRGGMGATVTSIIVVGITLLLSAVSVIGGVSQMAQQPSAGLGLCVMIVPVVLLIATLVLLIQAARVAPRVKAMLQQQQFQMWQYQQQQMAYQQGGYAMPQQPPAPPAAPAPQPPGEDVPR